VVFEPPRDTGWPPGEEALQHATLLALLVQKYKYRREIRAGPQARRPFSTLLYLLYWYKSTNTDAAGAAGEETPSATSVQKYKH
jgi:hypothetical protein